MEGTLRASVKLRQFSSALRCCHEKTPANVFFRSTICRCRCIRMFQASDDGSLGLESYCHMFKRGRPVLGNKRSLMKLIPILVAAFLFTLSAAQAQVDSS